MTLDHLLVAGDHFIKNDVFVTELVRAGGSPVSPRELTLPWPIEPFGPVGNVIEASGTEDDLLEALDGIELCVTHKAPFTKRVLESSPELQFIGVARGGPVNVDIATAQRLGKTVTFAPGRNAAATAEHTIALMLAALRHIVPTHNELMTGTWRGDYYTYDTVGMQLDGTTVGLVGYGAIGQRVAAVATAFGACVLAYDPYADSAAAEGVELVDLDELLRRSSVVSLHARVTQDNVGMIGRQQLESMPSGSVLVNCARAALLDYDAACDALDSGHLAGLGIDVFPDEPVPATDRLLRTPNVVATPHIGGASKGTAHVAAQIVAADAVAFASGEEPTFVATT